MDKQILQWRIQAGAPFGLHVWFDPRVEHVVLLEGPDPEMEEFFGEEKVNVDAGPQQMILWNGDSVSGRGKREALRSNEIDPMSDTGPKGLEDIPF